jgi:hypothetical protein
MSCSHSALVLLRGQWTSNRVVGIRRRIKSVGRRRRNSQKPTTIALGGSINTDANAILLQLCVKILHCWVFREYTLTCISFPVSTRNEKVELVFSLMLSVESMKGILSAQYYFQELSCEQYDHDIFWYFCTLKENPFNWKIYFGINYVERYVMYRDFSHITGT